MSSETIDLELQPGYEIPRGFHHAVARIRKNGTVEIFGNVFRKDGVSLEDPLFILPESMRPGREVRVRSNSRPYEFKGEWDSDKHDPFQIIKTTGEFLYSCEYDQTHLAFAIVYHIG